VKDSIRLGSMMTSSQVSVSLRDWYFTLNTGESSGLVFR
jgi:hypothetical protein